MGTIFDAWQFSLASFEVASASHVTGEALAQLRHRRLTSLLRAVSASSKLYSERLAGLAPQADALPHMQPVTRQELMARFSDWVSDPSLRLEELTAFTADPANAGEPYLGKYLVWESSGTSGSPGIFVQDARCMALYDALESQRRGRTQATARLLDPFFLGERIAFVGAVSGHFASYITMERLRRLQPWLASSVRSFSIMQPLDDLVRALEAFAPTVLTTYPTAAAMLGHEVDQGRLYLPSLREVWTGGETLGHQLRKRLQKQLGATVHNSYGASEFLAMGWECDHGYMHLNSDWVLLEPVDDRYRPVPRGEPSASVLLTHLANTAQPLIRYDLGDHLTLSPETCTCGCPLPVFEVQGRRDDTLKVSGPGGRSVLLLPLALTTVLEESAGLFDFQICQKDDRTLVLRLPSEGREGRAALTKARRVLSAFVEAQGALPITVKGELGVRVPRGRSGKSCRILPYRS